MNTMEILETLVEIDKEARLEKICEHIANFTERECYIQEYDHKHKWGSSTTTTKIRNIVIPSTVENKLTMTAHWDVSGDDSTDTVVETDYSWLDEPKYAHLKGRFDTTKKYKTYKARRSGGYNDNLSSVAILLTLLQDGKITEDVELVFTDHEEIGGYGMSLYSSLCKPKLVYNFDINGVGDTVFWDNNRFKGLPTPENAVELDVIFNDSHITATEGIPSVLIMSGHINAKSVVGDIMQYQHCGIYDEMKYIVPDQMQVVYDLACDLIANTDVETLSQVEREPYKRYIPKYQPNNTGESSTLHDIDDSFWDEYDRMEATLSPEEFDKWYDTSVYNMMYNGGDVDNSETIWLESDIQELLSCSEWTREEILTRLDITEADIISD